MPEVSLSFGRTYEGLIKSLMSAGRHETGCEADVQVTDGKQIKTACVFIMDEYKERCVTISDNLRSIVRQITVT